MRLPVRRDRADLDHEHDAEQVEAHAPAGERAAAAGIEAAVWVAADRQHDRKGGEQAERHQREAARAEGDVADVEREASNDVREKLALKESGPRARRDQSRKREKS